MKARIQAALALAAVVAGAANDTFNWDTITPSRDLKYHVCYQSFHCARLLLPLDWLDQNSTETIALALIKSPAVVPVHDPTYAGPVLSNPGGPGGSGVDFLRRGVADLRDRIDTPGRKHFEYVSFDPRGIGFTTPRVDCYPDGRLARSLASLKSRGTNGLGPGSGPAALSYNLGLVSIYSDRCAKHNGELLKFVGTTSVARDMLAVVDKIAEHNGKQTSNGTEVYGGARLEMGNTGGDGDNLPRLQYIGFSYGTVLGNYFAAMFPGRVGRLVLDGVCDTDDYATGEGWLTNTVDTDEMVDLYFRGCFGAGRDICPLVHDGDTSGADISRRFWAWVDGLDESPTFVTNATAVGDVLQSRDLRLLLFVTMYRPSMYPFTAARINEAMRGNTSALYDLVSDASGGRVEDACPSGNSSNSTASHDGRADAPVAILCGDAGSVVGRDGSFWRGYIAKQLTQSSIAGALMSVVRLSCAYWRTPAKWQFRGPFTTPPPSRNASTPEPGRPAAPVFFLSNRFDPVTPLRAARSMARQHPGAGVLVQEAMGHCVFGTTATNCTRDLLRRYFDEGVVPAEETTCEAACQPWTKCKEGKLGGDYGQPHYLKLPLHI